MLRQLATVKLIITILFSPLLVDTIEANVEKAYSHVEEGTEQLQKASTYQVGFLPCPLHLAPTP